MQMRSANDYTLLEAIPALGRMTGRAFLIHYDARPLPVNAFRKLHWAKQAEYIAVWRNTFATLARRVPHLDRVAVIADQLVSDHKLPDVGAAALTLKAAIDGLRDARVINEDTPDIVALTAINAPTYDPFHPDRFILTILELTP